MSVRKLVLLDPFNEKHLNMIREYDLNSDNNPSLIETIKDNINGQSKEEYLKEKKESNEIDEILFMEENSKIKDYCHIIGEKDIKICKINFPCSKSSRKSFVSLITFYSQNELGSEQIFISVDEDNKSIIKTLEGTGYESLGEEGGKIIYLKEKDKTSNKGILDESVKKH